MPVVFSRTSSSDGRKRNGVRSVETVHEVCRPFVAARTSALTRPRAVATSIPDVARFATSAVVNGLFSPVPSKATSPGAVANPITVSPPSADISESPLRVPTCSASRRSLSLAAPVSTRPRSEIARTCSALRSPNGLSRQASSSAILMLAPAAPMRSMTAWAGIAWPTRSSTLVGCTDTGSMRFRFRTCTAWPA